MIGLRRRERKLCRNGEGNEGGFCFCIDGR